MLFRTTSFSYPSGNGRFSFKASVVGHVCQACTSFRLVKITGMALACIAATSSLSGEIDAIQQKSADKHGAALRRSLFFYTSKYFLELVQHPLPQASQSSPL